MQSGQIPHWMVCGKTVFIQKDFSKGTVPSNCQPITCLPNIWKILTSIISDKMYKSLDERGARKLLDLIFINDPKGGKKKKKNLAMCWIDYHKACDIVPHSWIMECLTMFKKADNAQNLLQHAILLRKVELTSNNQNFGNVEIKRRMFHVDSLSPLLLIIGLIPLTLILRKCKEGYEFSNSKERINHLLHMDDLKLYGKTDKGLDSLIQTVIKFSSDKYMEFGIEKGNILKKGIKDENCDVILPNDLKVSSLKEGENCKYLGITEAEDINTKENKRKIQKEKFQSQNSIVEISSK